MYDVICDVKSADNRCVCLSNKLKKNSEKMTLFIFDSDSGPLLGFTQIQYQCK